MTGMILAGGNSRRMGSDKALLPWGEGSLLATAVDKLTDVCQEIVVVGRRRELARNVRWTQDRYVGQGPLAGLHAGLEVTAFAGAMVLACDMPLVSPEILKEILRWTVEADIVIPVHSQGYEPLCAWYRKNTCLPVVKELLSAGHCRLQDILPRVKVARMEMKEQFPGMQSRNVFLNINTLSEYERQFKKLADAMNGRTGKLAL